MRSSLLGTAATLPLPVRPYNPCRTYELYVGVATHSVESTLELRAQVRTLPCRHQANRSSLQDAPLLSSTQPSLPLYIRLVDRLFRSDESTAYNFGPIIACRLEAASLTHPAS